MRQPRLLGFAPDATGCDLHSPRACAQIPARVKGGSLDRGRGGMAGAGGGGQAGPRGAKVEEKEPRTLPREVGRVHRIGMPSLQNVLHCPIRLHS